MVSRFAGELPEESCQDLRKRVSRCTILLTIGLKGTPSSWILGSPYFLGGLEPVGRSCLQVSSVSAKFLSNELFFFVESVGSFLVFCRMDLPGEPRYYVCVQWY
jgi:hypothetical protein